MKEGTPPLNEAATQAKARAQALAAAFKEVFGLEKSRTASQKSVLEHLGTCASDDSNSYRFHDGQDGISRIAAGIHIDGAKSLLRVIDRQLKIFEKTKQPAKSKSKSIRS